MSFVSLTTPIGANLLDEDGNGHRSGQIHVNGSDAGVVFFTDLEGNVLLKFTFREPGTRHILRHYSVDGARMIAASFYIRYNLREDGLISLRNLVLRSSVIPENRGPEQVQMTVKLRHGGITMDTIDHEFTVFYTDAAE